MAERTTASAAEIFQSAAAKVNRTNNPISFQRTVLSEIVPTAPEVGAPVEEKRHQKRNRHELGTELGFNKRQKMKMRKESLRRRDILNGVEKRLTHDYKWKSPREKKLTITETI